MKVKWDKKTYVMHEKNIHPCPSHHLCPICKNILDYGRIELVNNKTTRFIGHKCNSCDIFIVSPHNGFLNRDLTHNIGFKLITYEQPSPRLKLVGLLGSVCSKCRIGNADLLDIHHKFNDGKSDREQYSLDWYDKYLNDVNLAKERLELLCKNCHWLIHRKVLLPRLMYTSIKKINKKQFELVIEN